MSAHILLNILNRLRKRGKMLGLDSNLSNFGDKFDKFNNSRAQVIDSIYFMTLKLLEITFLGMKTSRFCHILHSHYVT